MLNIVICDDERKDLDKTSLLLRQILDKLKITYKICEYESAEELLCNKEKINLAILDIAMEEMNGIDLGRKIKIMYPNVQLMYTTSYEWYCYEAINRVHAFSFLSKPLNYNELEQQIWEILDKISGVVFEKEFTNVLCSDGKCISSLKIKLEDILYFEYIKRQRKVTIVLKNETYEYECVFEKLVKELEQYDFVVNCRGNLVNLVHVVKIKGYLIMLDNGQTLPVSQKRCLAFKDRMNQFLQKKS